jgi:hypothetical protein
MQNKIIINFLSTVEKKALYAAACKDLGISISEVCRRALDNTVALSEKLKTPAPSIPIIPEEYGKAHEKAIFRGTKP